MAGRSPNWAQDELILALDLYLRRGIVDDEDAEAIALSELLNSLDVHVPKPDNPTFRNATGVSLKLSNFAALDPAYPGVGMTRGGAGDRRVWDQFHSDPGQVAKMSAAIRAGASFDLPPEPQDEEAEVAEGRILYRMHRTRERDSSLAKRVKAKALEMDGRLYCRVCEFDFAAAYGELGEGYIECHHIVPLAELGETKTKAKDLVLLCANCHRMAHRRKPWPSIGDLRTAWLGR